MIRRSPLRLAIVTTATALAVSSCATFTNTDVVARVGDAELTTSEFTTRAETTIGAVDGPINAEAARGVVSNWIYLTLADGAGLVDAHDSGPDNTGVACLNVFVAPEAAADTAIDRLRSGDDPVTVGSELDPAFTGHGSIGCGPMTGFNPEIVTQLAGISIDDPYRIIYVGADTYVVSLQPRSQINGIELLQAVQAVSPDTVASVLEAITTSDIYVNPRFGSFQPDVGGVVPLGGTSGTKVTIDHHAGRPRIVVVGLGPGGIEHITGEALTAIERISHRFLRTTIHPSAHLVPDAASFDELYEQADRFEDVYAAIGERLVASATEHGEVLYAVPGSPLVLERSVRTLQDDDRVDVTIVPAMSFLDVVWARLGIDPVEAGVRLVDGHEFATAAAGQTGPLLIAHTHANWVLSDIKLSIDDPTGDLDNCPVVLLQALGTPHERIVTTTWAEMDRTIEADHLTSLYVPGLCVAAGEGYVRFHELARTLREQCPWDIEQTHHSLVPFLIEETYEVVDAIQALDPDDPLSDEHLIEELGDLLYQVEFHATIAEQQGRFTIADVTAGIHDKLVRRHPHVFGDAAGNAVDVDGTDQVLSNWEAIKRAEKNRTSAFDGVPGSLPSLAYAHQLQRKAAKLGFDWPDVDGALPKIAEEAAELVEAAASGDPSGIADELGDLLFAVVNVSRHLLIDPESALRAAANKFRSRFERVESLAAERGIDLQQTDLAGLDALWDEVKRWR